MSSIECFDVTLELSDTLISNVLVVNILRSSLLLADLDFVFLVPNLLLTNGLISFSIDYLLISLIAISFLPSLLNFVLSLLSIADDTDMKKP